MKKKQFNFFGFTAPGSIICWFSQVCMLNNLFSSIIWQLARLLTFWDRDTREMWTHFSWIGTAQKKYWNNDRTRWMFVSSTCAVQMCPVILSTILAIDFRVPSWYPTPNCVIACIFLSHSYIKQHQIHGSTKWNSEIHRNFTRDQRSHFTKKLAKVTYILKHWDASHPRIPITKIVTYLIKAHSANGQTLNFLGLHIE